MNTLSELREIYPVFQIGASLVLIIFYMISRKILVGVVLRRALKNNFEETRATYIKKAVTAGLVIILIVLVGIVWEISMSGLSVYVASFLTIAGVGLFANWSIISNITASVILFFFFPFKIGSKVRVVDGDNSAEGEVVGLSLFSIRIKREDGNEVYVPNNLAIQKTIVDLGGTAD
ncbi:MAG: mechanosensitive ion channel domain-containing protein [Cyclobacteriaceae bacterium]